MTLRRTSFFLFFCFLLVLSFTCSDSYSDPLSVRGTFSNQFPIENYFELNGLIITGTCLVISGIVPLLIWNNSKNAGSLLLPSHEIENLMLGSFVVLEVTGITFIYFGSKKARASYSIGAGNTHKIELTFNIY
jgi:hypothetical protein